MGMITERKKRAQATEPEMLWVGGGGRACRRGRRVDNGKRRKVPEDNKEETRRKR